MAARRKIDDDKRRRRILCRRSRPLARLSAGQVLVVYLSVLVFVFWIDAAASATTNSENQQEQHQGKLSASSRIKSALNDLLQGFVSTNIGAKIAGGGNGRSQATATSIKPDARGQLPRTQQRQQQVAPGEALVRPTKQAIQSRLVAAVQQAAQVTGSSANGGVQPAESEYRCAQYCSCSMVQSVELETSKGSSGVGRTVLERRRVNMTQVKCESEKFIDPLSIDRRTQIIHISLPPEVAPEGGGDESGATSDESPMASSGNEQAPARRPFRMPRLIQFNQLREIVIVNLRFEVCDAEVFKRGQKLRRFVLNRNRLSRISKSCLRHLDTLLELNLDHNELEDLESALFSGLLQLRSLSLAHNRLTDLSAHQFANLTQLASLNLIGNSFKSINLQSFEPMQDSLRLLLLAKNQIKSFVAQAPASGQQPLYLASKLPLLNGSNATILQPTPISGAKPSAFTGVMFKQLVKLNVDYNKFERIKLLQLHRFFNVKLLSVRHNNIASIRDKAFNGLKLVELNLANNQLESISRCSFCNATIKRLILSDNNISLPVPVIDNAAAAAAATINLQPLAAAVVASANDTGHFMPEPQAIQQQPPVSSSPNLLILSQSIFGPLFAQLEYLDLSGGNALLAEHLELLLEPLLKLQYLNLASMGLERSLPSPTMFKNLRQLRYLNMSHNQLDLLAAETIEPLAQSLELLDLSHNKFSELAESLLVLLDEMAPLKLIKLSDNPWFCSHCKVAPLYDWILRSPIYNYTCLEPSLVAAAAAAAETPDDDETTGEPTASGGDDDAKQQATGESYAEGLVSTLLQADDELALLLGKTPIDAQFSRDPLVVFGNGAGSGTEESTFNDANYNLLPSSLAAPHLLPTSGAAEQSQLALLRSLVQVSERDEDEEDVRVAQTMLFLLSLENSPQQSALQFVANDYCLRCEFPSELRPFQIHELQPSDFKVCPGQAPKYTAKESNIGLTLAIVIIGALFCIIIIVIVMYRKKSNTYYTNEGDTDQLAAGGGKKPVFSISSDVEQQYGDNTDYSSPPMSQSYDESYSQEDDDDDKEDGDDEEFDDEDEEFDDDDEEMDDEAEVAPEVVEDDDDEDGVQHAKNQVEAARLVAQRIASAEQERRQQIAEYNQRNESQSKAPGDKHHHHHPAPADSNQKHHRAKRDTLDDDAPLDADVSVVPTGAARKQSMRKPANAVVAISEKSRKKKSQTTSFDSSQAIANGGSREDQTSVIGERTIPQSSTPLASGAQAVAKKSARSSVKLRQGPSHESRNMARSNQSSGSPGAGETGATEGSAGGTSTGSSGKHEGKKAKQRSLDAAAGSRKLRPQSSGVVGPGNGASRAQSAVPLAAAEHRPNNNHHHQQPHRVEPVSKLNTPPAIDPALPVNHPLPVASTSGRHAAPAGNNNVSSNKPHVSAAGKPPSGRQSTQPLLLGRQRFAVSKDALGAASAEVTSPSPDNTPEPPAPQQPLADSLEPPGAADWQAVPSGQWSYRTTTTNTDDNNYSPAHRQAPPRASSPARQHRHHHQHRQHPHPRRLPPTASDDATSADSLALDYSSEAASASDDAELGDGGGALAATTSEPEDNNGDQSPAGSAPTLLGRQVVVGGGGSHLRGSSYHPRMRESHSNHSALTQTSGQDVDIGG